MMRNPYSIKILSIDAYLYAQKVDSKMHLHNPLSSLVSEISRDVSLEYALLNQSRNMQNRKPT